MPPDVFLKVTAAEFGATARKLKEAGDKGMRAQLFKAVNAAAKPLRDAAPDAARKGIGNKHGFGERVASELKTTVRKKTGSNPSVTIQARRGKSPLGRLNQGVLRHPLYGRWKANDGHPTAYTTKIDAGWWEDELSKHAPEARRQIEQAVQDIRKQIM